MALFEMVAGVLSEVAKSLGTKVVADQVDDRRDRKAALFLQIMRLHDDLRRCHEGFRRHRSDQEDRATYHQWWEAVRALEGSLTSLGATLRVYSPKLSSELELYYDSEIAWVELENMKHQDSSTDTLRNALNLMTKFIRDNFTPEDFNYYFLKHYGK